MSACEVLLDDTVCVIQDGRKVVCGSQDGVLLLYSWGHMLDCRCELLPVINCWLNGYNVSRFGKELFGGILDC